MSLKRRLLGSMLMEANRTERGRSRLSGLERTVPQCRRGFLLRNPLRSRNEPRLRLAGVRSKL